MILFATGFGLGFLQAAVVAVLVSRWVDLRFFHQDVEAVRALRTTSIAAAGDK